MQEKRSPRASKRSNHQHDRLDLPALTDAIAESSFQSFAVARTARGMSTRTPLPSHPPTVRIRRSSRPQVGVQQIKTLSTVLSQSSADVANRRGVS